MKAVVDFNSKMGAVLDETEKYRYSLWRVWDIKLPRLLFIMLNPSTADHTQDDPTIRRCIGFAKSWGYGAIEVVNLFAYRATDPKELRNKKIDPIGIDNDNYIISRASECKDIVLAWGTNGGFLKRDKAVLKLLVNYKLNCLEETKFGHPKHPLFVKGDTMYCEYPKKEVTTYRSGITFKI
ncbi:MAG: DUF1643 domain-containing protein [Paenibacillus sp.]|nr:DUF1643 domain-containing protein [Paenibacillus sp.]